MPVRKIPGSYRSVTGRLACLRSGEYHEYESTLERDCLTLFSCDPHVAALDPQPVKIEFVCEDKKGRARTRHHIPDLLVRFRTPGRRPLLIEVKYRDELHAKREELLPKIRAGRAYARERGWSYRIYTDRHIRGVLLRNLKFVRPYLRYPRDKTTSTVLLSAVKAGGAASVAALIQTCGGADPRHRGTFLASLWRLVAAAEIGADLKSKPLSLETQIWPLNP